MAVTRQWQARIFKGDQVVLRNFLVLAPGEDATDDPPTVTLPWAQWLIDHDSVYGLTVDGRSTSDDTSLRQAITRMRNSANASPVRALDSNDMKAILRAFREVRAELGDVP